MEKLKTVDAYILKHEKWAQSLELLRGTIMHSGLSEAFKWGAPAYTYKGKNIVGLGAFNNHLGIWFFNGSLLKDTHKKLHNAQEGKTTAMRQWRILRFEDVVEDISLIESYIIEAKENVGKGKMVKPNLKKPLVVPDLLLAELEKDVDLKSAFESLSISKRRDYSTHIDSAKMEKTKITRLKKIIPLIKEGVGLHDKYRK